MQVMSAADFYSFLSCDKIRDKKQLIQNLRQREVSKPINYFAKVKSFETENEEKIVLIFDAVFCGCDERVL